MIDNKWKLIEENTYRKQENEREKEYLIVSEDKSRVTYIYKYFVLKSEDLYANQCHEKDPKIKFSQKYGEWIAERAYIDLETAKLVIKLLEK